MLVTSLYVTSVDLAGNLEKIYDLIFLKNLHPLEDEGGHIKYPVRLNTFAVGCDGTEYALDDEYGRIYCWSPGGGVGCLSESLDDFLKLAFNCPFYWDFLSNTYLLASSTLEQDIKNSEEKLLAYYPRFKQIESEVLLRFGVEGESNKAKLIHNAIRCISKNRLDIFFYEDNGLVHRIPTFLEW